MSRTEQYRAKKLATDYWANSTQNKQQKVHQKLKINKVDLGKKHGQKTILTKPSSAVPSS